MLLDKRIAATAAIAIATLTATPTAGSVSGTINLRAHVPVYCNVEFLPSLGDGSGGDGVINLGTSQEFCNAPRGYRVILEHPTNMPAAAVISDAIRIPLSESGETVVANSDHPGFQFRDLALDLGEDAGTINHLGLRIEVKY